MTGSLDNRHGKFDSVRTMALYEFSLNGFGETVGNTNIGSYTYQQLPGSLASMLEFVADQELAEEMLQFKVGILAEDSNGFVRAEWFKDEGEAESRWKERVAEIEGVPRRYAIIGRAKGLAYGRQPEVIKAYLPDNYEVIAVEDEGIVIAGHDRAGWTLDGYVIPRLASGLHFAREIEAPDGEDEDQ